MTEQTEQEKAEIEELVNDGVLRVYVFLGVLALALLLELGLDAVQQVADAISR